MGVRVSAKQKLAIREKMKGDGEPMAGPNTSRSDMMKALHWYNLNKDEKVAAKYLNIKDTNLAKRFTSLAWALRMKSRGFTFNEKEEATMVNMQAELNKRLTVCSKSEEPAQSTPTTSIQDRVNRKTEEYISELEGFIDQYGIRGKFDSMNAYQWMSDNGVKAMHAKPIAEHFRSAAKDILDTIKIEPEAYSTYNKTRLHNLLKCYASLVQDAEKFSANQKTARKPRKKKAVSAEKRVSKLKYCVKDDKLKLQSVDPTKVLGASQLWVFNRKTRKLGVYNALDASGLLVKGSSIEGYNSVTSVAKTLRKPEKVLPTVTGGGKVALRKVLTDINAKEAQLNGRINGDVILLRVVGP